MNSFCPGKPAAFVDSSLKSALKTMEDAKQNAVLWFGEVLDRGLFRQLGYASIHQYAAAELGFSHSRLGDFLSICRRLEKLPAVREELSAGRLGYTKAREVVKVADEHNEREWVEVARTRSRRELEQAVKQARHAAKVIDVKPLLPAESPGPKASPPVRVSLEMSATQFARYEASWEKLRKSADLPADRVEALLAVLGSSTADASPRGDAPPVQIHVHECPECGSKSVVTSRGERELTNAEAEQALCDCQIATDGAPNRSAIPPATRRQVLARARHHCEFPGCNHSRFLEIHHRLPRSRGGKNDPSNLITLCSACHARVHRHDLNIEVEAVRPVGRTAQPHFSFSSSDSGTARGFPAGNTSRNTTP